MRNYSRVFFYHFPKYHMKNILGDFNEKVGRENLQLGMKVYTRIVMTKGLQ